MQVPRNWTGFHVEAIDGRIGSIDEATYDTDASHLVVVTGPWIFGKKVMIPAGVISRIDPDERAVYVEQRQEQLKNAPPYDKDTRDEPAYRDALGSYYRGFHHHGAL